MIQLRSFEARDLPALHQLDQACFARGIAYSKAELQHFLTHPSCSCWIAEQPDNRLAGFVIIERVSLHGRPAGHIEGYDVPGGTPVKAGALNDDKADELVVGLLGDPAGTAGMG